MTAWYTQTYMVSICTCYIIIMLYSQAANDLAKKNKSLTQQLKEVNALYEDEQRTRDEQHQLATKAEKRANDLQLEVEEIKAQLEQVKAHTN